MQVESTVNTGTAAITFDRGFTNDDGVVDDEARDPSDTGDCPVGRATGSSCDPTGAEGAGQPRLPRDLASCRVELADDARRAILVMQGAYPGYFCRSWYEIKNIGAVPLIVSSVQLNNEPLAIDQQLALDLDGNGSRDLQLTFFGLELCQQVDPGHFIEPGLRTRVLGGIPQLQSLRFEIELSFLQWNAPCEQQGSQSSLFGLSSASVFDKGTHRVPIAPGLPN